MDFPFRRLIVWGLRTQPHTHRFVHMGFYTTAQKLGIDVLRVDDDEANAHLVKNGDLVLSVNVAGSHLPTVPGAKYVLHNFGGCLDDILAKLGKDDYISLQVYTKASDIGLEQIANCTFYDRESRTLIQPWGTPLLRHEFLEPAGSRLRHLSFWVGSVWDNELGQGNRNEYRLLKRALRRRRIYMIRAKVSEGLGQKLIHHSALAPAVGGRWQVDNGYLPCRMFKNISFGQVGASNIGEFSRVFDDAFVHAPDIEKLVDLDASLSDAHRRELIAVQQEIVGEHTYEKKIARMVSCF